LDDAGVLLGCSPRTTQSFGYVGVGGATPVSGRMPRDPFFFFGGNSNQLVEVLFEAGRRVSLSVGLSHRTEKDAGDELREMFFRRRYL